MDLKSARESILRTDMEIISLIKKRQILASAIHEAKKKDNIPIRDESQRNAVLRRAYEAAEEKGIDPESVQKIFEILIEINEKAQTEMD